MKKPLATLLAALMLALFCTACQTSTNQGVASSASAQSAVEPQVSSVPQIEENVYTQSFLGADATVGNLLFTRDLQKIMGDEVDGLSQQNTLELVNDSEYILQKNFTSEGKDTFNHAYTFTGTYTEQGGELTLAPPQSVSADVDWGTLDGFFPRRSGTFTEKDSLAYPMSFNTPFVGYENGNNEMRVTLNEEDHSFKITGNGSADDTYKVRELSTERDGLKIYGEIILPADYTEGKLPVVIFSHGFISTGLAQKDIAIALAQNGIATYCFDYCGGTVRAWGCRSDGEFAEMSMLTEKADLHTVVDFIKQQDFTDLSNIYLLGESMGGAVAALVAAERPEDIKAQMHLYPAFSISEQTRAVYSSADDIPDTAPTSAGVNVNGTFYKDAYTIDIYPEIAPYEGPVLMFQGDSDIVVPLVYVEQSLNVLQNAQLVVYKGEGHIFTPFWELDAVAKMLEFLKQQIAQ